MKKIHYKNIGLPKTGTTWLWEQFKLHPEVDFNFYPNTHKEYRAPNLESYKKVYEKYNVSVNLDTHLYSRMLPENHYLSAKNIHECTSHITMILRNPYEVINSMFNMEKNRNINYNLTPEQHIKKCYQAYSGVQDIFSKWDKCKRKIKYLIYDDFKANPENFFYDICDFIGIEKHYKNIGTVFKTDIKHLLIFDDSDIINSINENIGFIEKRLDRDLSHWKKI